MNSNSNDTCARSEPQSESASDVRKAILAHMGIGISICIAMLWLLNASSPSALFEVITIGDVPVDAAFRRDLLVVNNSNSTLTIERFEVSCFCVSVHPHSLVVAPGQSVYAELRIDLTKTPGISESSRARIELEVVARGRSDEMLRRWTVVGHAIQSLSADPSAIELNEIEEGVTPVSVRFRVRHVSTDVELTASIPAEYGCISLADQQSGECATFVYTPSPRREKGRFHTRIEVASKHKNGSSAGSIYIPVSGVVYSDVESTPAQISLGILMRNAVANEAFVLQSRSGQRFSIKDIQVGSGNIAVSFDQTEATSSLVGNLKILAQETGEFIDKITVSTTSDSGKEMNVTIHVLYKVVDTNGRA